MPPTRADAAQPRPSERAHGVGTAPPPPGSAGKAGSDETSDEDGQRFSMLEAATLYATGMLATSPDGLDPDPTRLDDERSVADRWPEAEPVPVGRDTPRRWRLAAMVSLSLVVLAALGAALYGAASGGSGEGRRRSREVAARSRSAPDQAPPTTQFVATVAPPASFLPGATGSAAPSPVKASTRPVLRSPALTTDPSVVSEPTTTALEPPTTTTQPPATTTTTEPAPTTTTTTAPTTTTTTQPPTTTTTEPETTTTTTTAPTAP